MKKFPRSVLCFCSFSDDSAAEEVEETIILKKLKAKAEMSGSVELGHSMLFWDKRSIEISFARLAFAYMVNVYFPF